MKPFLKWVGGKRSVLPHILPRLPEDWINYFEPFVGGGALFFELSKTAPQPIFAVLTDTNQELIWTYTVMRDRVRELFPVLQELRVSHPRPEFFYEIRDYFNEERKKPGNLVDLAAMFLYLNKACFNGLMRTNASGDFNSPRGSYETIEFDEENLLECSEALQRAELHCGDFASVPPSGKQPKTGDLWYADPPYIPLKKSSFTKYGPRVFSMEDHVRLRDYAMELKERGVSVLLSNSDTPETLDLYVEFALNEVEVKRSINRDSAGRGKVGELIISSCAFPRLSDEEIKRTLKAGAKAANELHKTLQNQNMLTAESAGLRLR